MSTTSKIEWTEKTWNPVRGCSLVSPGCKHCYAMKQAHRFSGKGAPYEGLTELGPDGPRWTGKVQLLHDALDAPRHWKKPARIFVNSMSDLFHEDVPFAFIDKVFGIMFRCPQHTFQILTKRPGRMHDYVTRSALITNAPLENVWLGVSVENQIAADARIPPLLQTPAAVRWVSAEPLLEEIDLTWVGKSTHFEYTRWNALTGEASAVAEGTESAWDTIEPMGSGPLQWLVIGGESGPGARPFNIEWARKLIAQCNAAGVPVFMKQLGAAPFETGCAVGMYSARLTDRKGGNPLEWPEDVRVREYPNPQPSTRNR